MAKTLQRTVVAPGPTKEERAAARAARQAEIDDRKRAALAGPIVGSPYVDDLQATISDLYVAIDTPRVSKDLFVCLCPVCMTEDTRQRIIATPMRDMPFDLICEYSNSAHEAIGEEDNIRAFLPRYLEVTARDIAVDYTEVGAEYLRFGDAIRQTEGFLNATQAEAYYRAAALMILHFGWQEADEADNVVAPYHLLDVFMAGGVPVPVLTDAMMMLFAHPTHGAKALIQFVGMLIRQSKEKKMQYHPNMFGLGYADAKTRQAFADWLTGPKLDAAVQAMFLRGDASEEDMLTLDRTMFLLPKFDASVFPDHRADR